MVINMEYDSDLVLDIREKERQRIARDLHDVTLQNLSHLIHKVELSSLYMEQDIVKAKLELATIDKELRNIIEEMRTIIYNMHPISLEDLGLKTTMERMIHNTNKNYNFFIETDIEDVSCENKNLQIIIFRLTQECVINALKHSNGNKLSVSLKYKDNTYIINVIDNGIGFIEKEIEKKYSHYGLAIMKERVKLVSGKMNINSSGSGTSIKIEIPNIVD